MRRWIGWILTVMMIGGCLLAAAGCGGTEPARAAEASATAAAETELTGTTAEAEEPPTETGPAETTGETGPEETVPEQTESPEPPWPGYSDVSGHWAEREILLLHELKLMDGMTDELFAPSLTMSRAMFVVVLYRLEGLRTGAEPECPAAAPFLDVPEGSWYAKGVAWARETGIVQGVTDELFQPNGPCTREQSVVLVRRYLRYIGFAAEESAWLGSYEDAASLSLYARGAMSWAVAVGLIQGTDEVSLSPRDSLTRAQFAMIAVRLLDLLDGKLEAPELPGKTDPEASSARIEVDHRTVGTALLSGQIRYLKLSELMAAFGGTFTEEEEDGIRILHVLVLGEDALFYDGFSDVRAAGRGRGTFRGPALRGQEDWYLPSSAMRPAFGRQDLYDREEDLIRCLPVTEGAGIWLNGVCLGTLACDGVAVLPADKLAANLGGSAANGADADGTGLLTLTAKGHSLRFTQGLMTAAADGALREIPVPAWREGSVWYVPAELTGQLLGCSVYSDSSLNRVDLLYSADGAEHWFGGVYLGRCRALGQIPCGTAEKLAEAVGGTVGTSGLTMTLTAMGHTVTYSHGSIRAAVDGAPALLPLPAVRTDSGWQVPLRPLAQALGLKEVSSGAGKLAFSRIGTATSVLWVDGKKYPACYQLDGVRYLRLSDVIGRSGASLKAVGNTATFTAWGKTVTLTGGSASAKVGGSALTLSGPALADGDQWYAPASELLQAMGLSELVDTAWNQVFYTKIVRNADIAAGYRVPILMYHAVSDNIWGIRELFVSPANMEAQLKALVQNGYTAITFEDLDHISSIQKPVMLTFDDGYLDNYTELFPLLKKYHVKATFFVIVDAIGNSRSMTKAQLKELSDSGLVSIQSHTMSHGYLDEMNASQLQHEFYDSMLAIARITGKQPFVLCYPSGKNSALARTWAAKYYQYGLCMGGPCYVTGSAPFLICRYYIARSTTVATFLSYLG